MRTALRVVAFVFALLAAWLLVFRSPPPDPGVVPGTNVPAPLVLPEGNDSLDLEVVGTMEHGTVHAVELRPAPAHRILAFDPATGDVATVLGLTNHQQVLGLAAAPDGRRLAVAYTPDVLLRGNGLSLLDLEARALVEVVPAVTGVWLTDPLWDGEDVLLTRTDTRVGDPTFEIVRVDVATGAVAPVVADAVTPARIDDDLFFLEPDEQANGRAVRRLGVDGAVGPVVQAEGDATIDHLLALPTSQLLFAVHQVEEGGVAVGAPAFAHTGPSVWWTASVDRPTPGDWGLPSSSVLDAVVTAEGAVLAVDREGLSITRDGVRHRLLDSRTLVFVAG